MIDKKTWRHALGSQTCNLTQYNTVHFQFTICIQFQFAITKDIRSVLRISSHKNFDVPAFNKTKQTLLCRLAHDVFIGL